MKRLICWVFGHVHIAAAYCPYTRTDRPICLFCHKGL